MWAGERTVTVSPAKCLAALATGVQPQTLGRTWYQRYGHPKGVPPSETHSPASLSSTFSMRAVVYRQRACVANLKVDLHRQHWEVLRSILQLYQAITTVQIGDVVHALRS